MATGSLAVASPARSGLPEGFQQSVVLTGLGRSTAVRFSPDGRIFVAEKSGLIKVFDGLDDPTPTVFADLSTEVDDYWDRGLLGLALDPGFPDKPYVYALYTRDAEPGGTPPRWNDACPNPPGPTTGGCVVTGRLVRLTASGDVSTGEPRVLLEGWCQQYPSHSVGDLRFGLDGALYVSGGDGAGFTFVDSGQRGNPCGDPPDEGGSLRAQSLRRASGPVLLSGAILRVNPATGAAAAGNPLAAAGDANARRIVAYGLRNPFRFTLRPGTTDLWIGDVGLMTWEELDRVPDPVAGPPPNFGWPCYEGVPPQGGYQDAALPSCTGLYAAGTATPPSFAYGHDNDLAGCAPIGGSSITGLAFYNGGSYPSSYDGALFLADHTRRCIWVMPKGADGLPAPGALAAFAVPAANPVDLEIGPGGDLFYVDFDGGQVWRVQYFRPTAVATATPTIGPAPLTVTFDGTASTSPQPGDSLTYEWDLDGDGVFDDSSEPRPTTTYTTPGAHVVRLRVTESHGFSAVSAPLTIGVDPPTPAIASPSASARWSVGDRFGFSGSGTDAQDGALPPSALTWTFTLFHCRTETECHAHVIQSFPGVAGGVLDAPDHDYPSYLELRLTATDSDGLSGTTSVRLDPNTVDLTFATVPAGLQIAIGGAVGSTPVVRRMIVGSSTTVGTPSPQGPHKFWSWSDGGAQTHTIVAPASPATFTAIFIGGSSSGDGGSAVRTLEHPQPDLRVALAAGRGTVTVGSTLRYVVTVANAGTGVGSAVSLDVRLPAQVRLVSAAPGCEGVVTLECRLGALGAGETRRVDIAVRVTHAGRLLATAAARGDEADARPDDNSASTTVVARARPSAPRLRVLGVRIPLSARGLAGTVRLAVDVSVDRAATIEVAALDGKRVLSLSPGSRVGSTVARSAARALRVAVRGPARVHVLLRILKADLRGDARYALHLTATTAPGRRSTLVIPFRVAR